MVIKPVGKQWILYYIGPDKWPILIPEYIYSETCKHILLPNSFVNR